MPKGAFLNTIREYSGAWRARRVSKAYLRRKRHVAGRVISRQHEVEVRGTGAVGVVVEAGQPVRAIRGVGPECQVLLTGSTAESTKLHLASFWQRYTACEFGFRFEPRRSPLAELVARHEVGHFSTSWNWQVAELEEKPLVQYTVFFEALSEDALAHPWLETREAIEIPQPVEPDSDFWSVAQDESSPDEIRLQALQGLTSEGAETVARFVVTELGRDDIAPRWRNNLVLFAEQIQFEDDEVRGRLSRLLLRYAVSLRQSTAPGTGPVVHSAIRLYGSLISPCDAASLLPLLDPPNPIETRLVTLHCIVHLFTPQPPQADLRLRPLSDRVYELADKFLDKDWLVPGEKAAIGQNATHALAALADQRLGMCIQRIRSLGLSWLTRQVGQKLEMTLEGWRAATELRARDAIRLLHEQVEALRR